MPATQTIVLFMAAALALNVTPGPSIVYVMSRSFGQGRTAGLVSALGLGTGSLIHAIAATLGLSAIVAYSPMAYAMVKYLGAAYLLYLGVGLLRQRAVPLADSVPLQLSLIRVYWQGVLTEILNPKIALFFLSFLPQFVDPARGSVAGQTLFFGLLFHATGLPINMLVAVAGSAIAAWFSLNPLFERIRNWLSGIVLIGLGVRLALSERRW
jgi:threonine/homoserine/homoserine lactone efflux protein